MEGSCLVSCQDAIRFLPAPTLRVYSLRLYLAEEHATMTKPLTKPLRLTIVCYEALAAGLPVITTPNVGSVVRDGIDGAIVPIRESYAIVEKLGLLTRDRELLAWMSSHAVARSGGFTIEKYGERRLGTLCSR